MAVRKLVTPPKQYSYFRLVIGGTIADEQTWSVGLSFTANPNTSQDDMQGWTEARVPDVVNWWTAKQHSPQSNCTADTDITSLRLYLYLAGQKAATSIAEAGLPSWPGTSNAPGTARDSLVVGLYASQPGAHYRGRVYVPCTGPFLQPNHQFAVETCTTFVQNTVTLLLACASHQMGGTSPVPVIASSLPEPPHIKTVRCDTIPDTQRKRSDKLGQVAEARETITIA